MTGSEKAVIIGGALLWTVSLTTANIYTHMNENSKVKSANAMITILDD